MADLERARVGKADDGRRMKSLSDGQARGQVLPGWNAANDRGVVAGLDPRSKAELLREIALQLRRIDTVAIGVGRVLGRRAEHRRELAIEVDQLVRNRAS